MDKAVSATCSWIWVILSKLYESKIKLNSLDNGPTLADLNETLKYVSRDAFHAKPVLQRKMKNSFECFFIWSPDGVENMFFVLEIIQLC